MVTIAPGNAPATHACQGGEHRPATARELEGVAAYEVAVPVGLVELLAPDAIARAAVAIQRVIEIAVQCGVGVEHQVASDQAT